MAELLSTEEAAAKLGISPRRVRTLIAEGKLEAAKVGRDYVISEAALPKAIVYGKRGRPSKTRTN